MNYLTKKLHALEMGNKFSGILRTANGYPLTLTDCTEGNLVDYTIYGNSVQNGTPSPDNPVEVQTVGDYDEESGKYVIPITVSGINMFNVSDAQNTEKYTFSSGNDIGNYRINLTEGKQYTLHMRKLISGNHQFSIYNDGEYVTKVDSSSMSTFKTFTAGRRVNLQIYLSGTNGASNTVPLLSKYLELMIVEGTYTTVTMPEYEEGHTPVTTNIYLDEPLRKIGEYADHIDFKNKEVVRVIGKMEGRNKSNLFKSYASMPSVGEYSVYWTSQFSYAKSDTGLCDRFPYSTNKVSAGNHFTIEYTSNRMYIAIDKNIVEASNDTQFQSWLRENNPIFYYVKKTETEESIALPYIRINKGTNIITVETGIQPMNIEISYYAEREE